MNAIGSCVSFVGANVQGGRAVDGFLKGSGHTSEFEDVVAPLGADGGFAVARGDAADDVFDVGGVASRVGGGWLRKSGGSGSRDGWSVEGVLLLEVDETICDGSLFDTVGNFHAAGRNIAEKVPPLRVVGERGIGDACDETGDFEEVVDFGEVSVWEGVACEATEDTARDKMAGSKDGFCDFA